MNTIKTIVTMKKLFFFGATLLLSTLSAGAVNFLVQTGEDSDPKWDQSVIDATGATLLDVKAKNKAINVILTNNVKTSNLEVWFAGGTYTFDAGIQYKDSSTWVGGFSGKETSIDQRVQDEDGNPWEWTNQTIFTGNNNVQLFTNNAKKFVLNGIRFQDFTSTGNGAIGRLGNNSEVHYCEFLRDTAASQGGALQVYNAKVTVTYCHFKECQAAQGGGFYSNSTSAITIENCVFEDNTATYTANAGGGVHVQNTGKVTIKNCGFFGNNSVGNGAALSFDTKEANSVIQNSVFYGNKGNKNAVYMNMGKFYYNTVVENDGGAMYAKVGDFKNNVFWGTSTEKAGMSVDTSTCVLDHNAALVSLAGEGAKAVVTNHIVLSTENDGTEEGVNYPKFVNVDNYTNLDLSLSEGSALIAAGVAIDGIAKDINGVTRENADLGAFAYQKKAPTSIDEAKNNTVDIEAALRAGEVYDIMGRRVAELQAGNIYLVEGAKVIMN